MNYRDLSFKTLRKLYDIQTRMCLECPQFVTESDHAERLAIAQELDRRNENGDTK